MISEDRFAEVVSDCGLFDSKYLPGLISAAVDRLGRIMKRQIEGEKQDGLEQKRADRQEKTTSENPPSNLSKTPNCSTIPPRLPAQSLSVVNR